LDELRYNHMLKSSRPNLINLNKSMIYRRTFQAVSIDSSGENNRLSAMWPDSGTSVRADAHCARWSRAIAMSRTPGQWLMNKNEWTAEIRFMRAKVLVFGRWPLERVQIPHEKTTVRTDATSTLNQLVKDLWPGSTLSPQLRAYLLI
jgi:hypothetical protein